VRSASAHSAPATGGGYFSAAATHAPALLPPPLPPSALQARGWLPPRDWGDATASTPRTPALPGVHALARLRHAATRATPLSQLHCPLLTAILSASGLTFQPGQHFLT